MKFMSLHYWLVLASALCAIVALTNQVDEARLIFNEVELAGTSWAVTVLRDAEIDRLAAGVEGNDAVKEYIYSPVFRERIAATERNKAIIKQLKTWNLQ
jgi:hypothetical protein